jgi:hypothetical protein
MKRLLKRIAGGLFILGFDVVIAVVGVFPGRGALVTAKGDPIPFWSGVALLAVMGFIWVVWGLFSGRSQDG